MGITFSGVGSGLPVQDWITSLVQIKRVPVDNLYTKKDTLNSAKTALSTVGSKFTSLKTSLLKFTDANIASTMDIFNAKKATSSDAAIATVSAANTAITQKVSLKVESLATSTKASSTTAVSKTITGTELFTDIANKQGVEGTFSLYTDGIKNEFTIEETDTLDDIVKKINDEFDPNTDGDYSDNNVKASIADGKLEINYNNTAVTNLTLGSSSDTSNFFNIMQLSTAALTDNGDGTSSFTSISPINTINLSGAIIGNAANLDVSDVDPITEGTFKIGKTEFTIDSTTTMSDLISKINKDADAGVSASFDSKENKLVLTSKTAGKTAINLENGTSNFLEKVGLVSAAGDSLTSQTLGNNAKIYINGSATALEANSNTVTGDISGITGLTINLKNTTEVGETIDINIDQDTDQISTALDDFITKFNAMTSTVDAQTAKDKTLHSEYSLVSLKNTFRSITTDRVSSLTDFDSLAMIGISTGAVGKAATNTSSTLTLDKDKLLNALQENPSEVKALLIGDSTTGTTGIFQKLQDKLTQVLDPVSGYFNVKEDSYNTMIANTDKSITRGEERITAYKALITKQFSQMDQYISQMQQSSQALSSIGNYS
ncbi:MAG: hypothetical protein A2104_05555 [Candidatus Melainabacteria bacterium GWF2_32_7]|nr:MAG: hypothetical protein A2104_05555 [Candidatus Melainabacteria bacterium GWF2_32_7]